MIACFFVNHGIPSSFFDNNGHGKNNNDSVNIQFWGTKCHLLSATFWFYYIFHVCLGRLSGFFCVKLPLMD